MFAVNLIITGARAVYDNVFSPIIDLKCQRRLNLEIYRRSLEIDLVNYENPAAFEMQDRAISNGAGAIGYVMDCIGGAVAMLIGTTFDVWIIFEIDPVLFVFAVIPWLMSPMQFILNKKAFMNITKNI